jgi:hypothetical protein
MPTPTFASLIMSTSFAPSPMASVRDDGMPYFTNDTICFFWSGRQRQQITDLHALDTSSRFALDTGSRNTRSAVQPPDKNREDALRHAPTTT